MKTGRLFLLPSLLSSNDISKQIPDYNRHIVENLQYFIVENLRTARRFLKQLNPSLNIDTLEFAELNEHTRTNELMDILNPIVTGCDGALVSEAGLPCVADPGNHIVFMSHQLGIRVIPLVGPSSLMLALMSSGFNGQRFTFHGYLPIDKRQREQCLKQVERDAWQYDSTQIFIETPYRNKHMLESIINVCRPDSMLCIALNLLSSEEAIITKTVKSWKLTNKNLDKQPAVFLLYK